jgi:hypothetical protein
VSEASDTVRVWRSAPIAAAAGLSGLWLAAGVAALWFLGGDGVLWLAIAVTLAMPLVVIWMAALLALQTELHRRETDRTLAAVADRTPSAAAAPPPRPVSVRPAAPPADPAASAPRAEAPERPPPPGPPAVDRPAPPQQPAQTAVARQPRQGNLPLPQPETAGLDVADLIRALDFPESLNDAEGFRALRRALRDPRAGRLVQASQDVLTLLGDDGLYMDDFAAEHPPADAWRRLAAGERSAATAAAGVIRDDAALETVGSRLRADAVFRDAAHHFLRLFDHQLADVAPVATDDGLVALADTRTGRAFMLIGRAVGMFG